MFPYLGRKVRELNDPNYRELVYRKYKVIYMVNESEVVILTVRSPYQDSIF